MEKAPGDSLNGLKFGEKIYFEDVGGRGSSSKSLSSLAGKRGMGVAAHAGGQQKPARCQVEGCNLDLTGAKAYYCRHKVCGMHSKSPKVIVAGLEQRFCQQCSRFHLLLEFDQGKRSCRRRLAGHNERRRKPPPPVPLLSPCGQLLSFHQDNRRSQSFLMHSNQPRPPNPINEWLGFANPYPRAIFSDSTSCALSLLSTQPWSSADAAAAFRANINGTSAISTSNRFDSSGPIAELNMASCYMMNSPWDFKDDEAGSSSLEMGIRQVPDSSHGCFSGELGLALQSPDDFVHHEEALHWPL